MSTFFDLKDIATQIPCPAWCSDSIHYDDDAPTFHAADMGAAAGLRVFVTQENQSGHPEVFIDLERDHSHDSRLSVAEFNAATEELFLVIARARSFAQALESHLGVRHG